ncbi:ABC transporter permease [Streptomyces sp. DK15]|uniref:ABC transporter permease n=1 Tax=Streptomyces sp. DK15 TaxID=2957499 RepID=UPI0029B9C6E4|nr:ABC transporter permease [Streptomyces sp. DK15]MDX2395213.1 ABC transporter permease [Streptomyces sp. DK15]
MSTLTAPLLVSGRMACLEYARNRLAIVLVLGFVPLWLTLEKITFLSYPVTFTPDGQEDVPVVVPGNDFSLIYAAANVVTLIIGFLAFTATFRGRRFDRRLVGAGFSPLPLFTGRLAAVAAASAATAGYTLAVILILIDVRRPHLVGLALLLAALTYASLGTALAAVLPGELEGMFVIIMISLLDSGLQNPMLNPHAADARYELLPTHGAVQAAASAAFSTADTTSRLTAQLTWYAALTFLSLLCFRVGTRGAARRG